MVKPNVRKIRKLLTAIQAVQCNLPCARETADAYSERLLGVEHGLLAVIKDENYTHEWLRKCSKQDTNNRVSAGRVFYCSTVASES